MNFYGNFVRSRLVPVIFFLSLTNVLGQTTINASSACITDAITLSKSADNIEEKPAFEGSGTVGGASNVPVAIYWSPADTKWLLAFDGQPYFYYEGDTDLPPNNVPGNWQQVTGTEGECAVTEKLDLGGDGTQNDPLPVTLISFNGRLSEKDILLEWSTTEELDNRGFEILHSVNLKSWKVLGTVSGKGTTSNQQVYTFRHANPSGGQNYYRLKQIDFSGKSTLSSIIQVNNPVRSIAIYPNPVVNELSFTGDENGDWKSGEILDVQGRYVQSIQPRNTKTPTLPPGKYFVRLFLQNNLPRVLPFVKAQ